MGFWTRDKQTGAYNYYQWVCPDNGEDPIKMNYSIESICDQKNGIRKTVAIDNEGKEHAIELIKVNSELIILHKN